MPRFSIRHITRYSYDQPVRDSANQVMLFPLSDEYQEVKKQDLTITGEPQVELYTDYYGNTAGAFTYAEPHQQLIIDSAIDVLVKERAMPADDKDRQQQWLHLQQVKFTHPYIDFIKQEPFTAIDEARRLPVMAETGAFTPLNAALQLNDYVFNNFQYDKAVTDVETTIDQVWKLKAGVCQDFAHVLLVLLRLIGIPSRYVSGYVCPNKSGLRGEGATHAWVESYIPFYGWLGLDPTNNCMVNDLHVRLATGRSFSDVSPVKGTYKGTSRHTLEVGVTISYEDGRVSEEAPAILVPQPNKNNGGPNDNSYRRHLEMIQQQQQQ
ncbi:MAG TPA: transglutaminase family protein [Chitinophagaceae bacterium]|nr:transglutaminase family protein [Chitinophagaceae bacterium]